MGEPFDVNFVFSVKELENDKVKLTPFIPSIYADEWFAATKDHPELWNGLTWGPFATAEEFVKIVIEGRAQSNPEALLFVVLDKTKPTPEGMYPLAACIGFLNTSRENLSTEIGMVITLPAFQRTHVTSNGIGLLLHYCLDVPNEGGLGLRRVQWQCNTLNETSRRAAERMGFKFERIERWQRVVPSSREGPLPREGDPRPDYRGRHSVILSVCWDDWDEVKEVVRKQMDRT
ncbi:hypothetical protein K474DRAFT_1603847 [Panus rudis PR-1116 ss-1]|nr:hypothetical protein K474DRAFT_1603847 [Panus rudis PR-1116 ss-1]